MIALARAATAVAIDGAAIGRRAADCLRQEIATYPKPGLVSPSIPARMTTWTRR